MNEIRRPIREINEIDAIRTIVARHVMPDFVTGFRLELGEFADNPAVWVTLLIERDLPPGDSKLSAWLSALGRIKDTIRDDLIEHYPMRYPIFDTVVASSVSGD